MSDTEQSLYPNLDVAKQQIKNEQRSMQERLRRYEKSLSRWKQASSSLAYTSFLSGGTTSIAGLSTLTLVSTPVGLGIGAAGLSVACITFLIAKSFIASKVSRMRSKRDFVKSYIDKIEVFSNKALRDNLFTSEEQQTFQDILDRYKDEDDIFKDPNYKKDQKILIKERREQAEQERLNKKRARENLPIRFVQ